MLEKFTIKGCLAYKRIPFPIFNLLIGVTLCRPSYDLQQMSDLEGSTVRYDISLQILDLKSYIFY